MNMRLAVAAVSLAVLLPAFASAQAIPAQKILPVPFITEVPDGKWVGSWKNACEEASIAMADRYYAGVRKPTKAWSRSYMLKLFGIERKLWGSDANSDAAMTAKLIDDNSSFGARVQDNVTADLIKAEIAAGRPVIAPINGFMLANKNIPFLASGSGYHMFAIVGYDEAAGDFIVHDNGDLKQGEGIRYSYARVMSALHDYAAKTHKADGPARAVFTFPKLAKTAGSHRIYYLSDGVKRYVSHPAVFAQKGWSWSWVNVVDDSFLAGFADGPALAPAK